MDKKSSLASAPPDLRNHKNTNVMGFRSSKNSRDSSQKVPLARSLPSSRPFYIAAVLSLVHYLSVIMAVASLVYCIKEPSAHASRIFIGAMVFSILTWIIAFFKRRSTLCPLCKGTPLIDAGALPHLRATKCYPFNHGVSATLSIIATQRFRCMYCAADFDLLKPSSRVRGRSR